jgi:cyclic pyranopterin phosphate synthase
MSESLPQASYKMVNVGGKIDTERRAVASGWFFAQSETLAVIRNRKLPNGDALLLAEVAGIQAAKQTSQWLPLCHPLNLTSVRIETHCHDRGIEVRSEVICIGKTGVEMEALAAVSAALLCIYDLTKMIDPVLSFGEVKLELKEGGKSGKWLNPNMSRPFDEKVKNEMISWAPLSAAWITLSDRAHQGVYEDRSGPVLQDWCEKRSISVRAHSVIPDEKAMLIKTLEDALINKQVELIITSGGTGASQRDITPEVVSEWVRGRGGRVIQGFGELMRKSSALVTSHAWLSRSEVYQVGSAVIVTLPGNPKAVRENLSAIEVPLKHLFENRRGEGHQ